MEAAAADAAREDVEMETTVEGSKGKRRKRGSGKGGDAKRQCPKFRALTAREMAGGKDDFRRIRCPPHRMTPLRNNWENIVTPTVEHMKLQIRQVSAVDTSRAGTFRETRGMTCSSLAHSR